MGFTCVLKQEKVFCHQILAIILPNNGLVGILFTIKDKFKEMKKYFFYD